MDLLQSFCIVLLLLNFVAFPHVDSFKPQPSHGSLMNKYTRLQKCTELRRKDWILQAAQRDGELEAMQNFDKCKQRLGEFLNFSRPSDFRTRSLYVRKTVQTMVETVRDKDSDKGVPKADPSEILQGEYEIVAAFMNGFKNVPPGFNLVLSKVICDLQYTTEDKKSNWKMKLLLNKFPLTGRETVSALLCVTPKTYAIAQNEQGDTFVLRSLEQKKQAIEENAKRFANKLLETERAGSEDSLSGYKVTRSVYKRIFQNIDQQMGTQLQYNDALLDIMPFVPIILLSTFLLGPKMFGQTQDNLAETLNVFVKMFSKV